MDMTVQIIFSRQTVCLFVVHGTQQIKQISARFVCYFMISKTNKMVNPPFDQILKFYSSIESILD